MLNVQNFLFNFSIPKVWHGQKGFQQDTFQYLKMFSRHMKETVLRDRAILFHLKWGGEKMLENLGQQLTIDQYKASHISRYLYRNSGPIT